MIPKGDITPTGVNLRDFTDYSAIRNDVLDSAMTSMSSKFPQEYGNYRIELDKIYYAEKEDYDLHKQKDALMKNSFLSKRLRGKLSLYDKQTGDKVDEKELTLMRVPYITDRGTTIHNGNEYVTLNQARLSSGIYTRKKDSGEIESHVNAKRGTGKSYRIRLEPETSLYKLDIDQASLRLYSLLHDIGISDDELELRWGPEILEINRTKYDSRVLDKAYNKLVRDKKSGASKEEKVKAILESLNATKISKSSVERTLPNLFSMKQASMLRKYGYQQNPALQGMNPAQNSEEFVKWDQKRQEMEAKAKEKEQKKELQRELKEKKKKLEISGLNKDILDSDGKVDDHAVIKQVMQNQLAETKAKQQIRTKKVVKGLKDKSKKHVDDMKVDDKLKDRYQSIKEKAEEQKVEQERDRMISQFQQQMPAMPQQQPVMPQQQPVMPQQQVSPEMPKVASEDADMEKDALSGRFARFLFSNKKKFLAGGTAYKMSEEDEEELRRLGLYEDDEYEEDEDEEDEEEKDARVQPGSPLDDLIKAKEDSDVRRFSKKHGRMRDLMKRYPQDFYINIKEGQIYGITHEPTNFRMHLPKHVIADLDLDDRSENEDMHKAAMSILGVDKSAASIPGAAFDLDPPNYTVTDDPLKSCSTCKKRDHTGKCNAFDFRCNQDYVCDAWEENLMKLARKGKYRQSPEAENVNLHTKTLPNGHEVDVHKLIDLTEGREVETIPIGDSSLKGANRSKRTGFGPKRYEEADLSKPILVDTDNNIIDGRHRYLKSVDEGLDTIDVRRVTEEDLKSSYTDNSYPDYSSSAKQ